MGHDARHTMAHRTQPSFPVLLRCACDCSCERKKRNCDILHPVKLSGRTALHHCYPHLNMKGVFRALIPISPRVGIRLQACRFACQALFRIVNSLHPHCRFENLGVSQNTQHRQPIKGQYHKLRPSRAKNLNPLRIQVFLLYFCGQDAGSALFSLTPKSLFFHVCISFDF